MAIHDYKRGYNEKILEKARNFRLPEEEKIKINEKRRYFQTQFSKERIENLDKEHYFQGKGIKEGNFTYELEFNSNELGRIGGGSVYKFGYEEDFEKIKKLLVKILSAENFFEQFYTKDGKLSEFSKEIVKGLKKASIQR